MHATRSRWAGYSLAGLLAVFLALNTYWALGGTWAVRQVLPEGPTPPPAVLWVQGLLVVAAIAIVLGRAGVWKSPLPSWVLQTGAWGMTVVSTVVFLMNLAGQTAWERFLLAPLALLVTALAAVVARAPRPDRVA